MEDVEELIRQIEYRIREIKRLRNQLENAIKTIEIKFNQPQENPTVDK